jgi:hypothetical protein
LFSLGLNVEQMKKLTDLDSKDKIINAFTFDIKKLNLPNDESWDL